ncbi:MAG: EamA family transporter [Gammaproteobacteria bacterium]|nr:EamA family transporter [Gammaproteobacteria bacterium]MYD75211.1 EamA family transporter [Gammaproteobacteria bacterium]MYJ51792.1 EamA family transporter [Gammaproteobacteria bacterium]
MAELWIPITIVAGFFQNLRSAIQKKLKDDLSTIGAAYSRFIYALPVALAYLFLLLHVGDLPTPEPNRRFLLFCLAGGISQILFTLSLLWTFSYKSFAVGTTFSKLEVIMVAIVAAAVLGETISQWAVLSICISSLGVLALSMGERNLSVSSLFQGLFSKSTLLGLMTASLLGASSALYRGATQALEYEPFYANAAYTLAVSLVMQTLIMGAWILMMERGCIMAVLRQWRWGGLAGVAGAFASICWFTAFTLQKAAFVRALGQIELVFTFIATVLYFREKVSSKEILGVILITAGILLLLLLG